MSVIGKPISRIDGARKATGAAPYAGESRVEGVAYGVLVGSAISRGRIKRLDASLAEAAPGTLLVLTHESMPKLGDPSNAMDVMSMPGESRKPLQDDRVHHAGQYIALVVAETLEQAGHAASLVQAEYEEERPRLGIEKNLDRQYAPKDFIGFEEVQYARGDADEAFATAARSVEATYSTPVEHHCAMEPHATLACWEGPRKLVLHDSTQAVVGTRQIVADMLGLDHDDVRVVCPFTGGGFGCKGFIWGHTLLAAVAARQLGRPVKIVLHRRRTFDSVGHRARTVQKLILAADADGALVATRHETISEQSEIGEFMEPAGLTTRLLYACPNVEVVHNCVRLNLGTPTAMRAPGESTGAFALECAMDELAQALGMDPIELRVKNHAEANPMTGLPFSRKRLLDCYRIGAEAFGWSRRSPAPRSMRDGRWLIGYGMATSTYPGFRLPASARARILADGTAVVESATQDIGTGTWTSMAQAAADALGLPLERLRFTLGDSDYPPAPAAGGSCTSASVGPAVWNACALVRGEAIRLATTDAGSPLHGLAAEGIGWGDGRLFAKDDPSRGETYAEILRRAGRGELEGCTAAKPYSPEGQEQSMQGGGKPTGQGMGTPCIPMRGMAEVDADMTRYAFQSFGAQFVEVRVDELLGIVRVNRVTSVQDVGRVLNAKTARSQVIGGVIMGLGMALTEETRYDPTTGRPVTRNLADYHVPSHADAPEIDARLLDEPDERFNALGARGLGEIGITGVAAAVANAVWHATGRRVRDLPITLDKIRSQA